MLHPAVSPAPARGAPPALPALRAATRGHHERLDRLIDLRRLRDARRYGRVLQVLDGFLAPWEASVAAALPPAWEAWLHKRSRRPFLQRDLGVLGLAAGHRPRPMPSLPTAGAAWGSVYVMEGSALGGQVITRSLADAGLRPDRGAAYFHGWGPATGAMWMEVRLLLPQQLADPDTLAQACAGACATFDALAFHLETALHERPPLA
jgi:heme oxygenase